MQQFVDKINAQLPVHAFWDGYYIRMFKRNNLMIGGSQDWIYYHNVDLIFKKVTFFNLPPWWRDTAIVGDDLFRLSSPEEFHAHFPEIDTGDRHVFAFDLHYDIHESFTKHSFFVLAANVFFEKLTSGDGKITYEDPLGKEGFWSKKNRVF
ncbi:MAG: hypothetical protein R3B47_21185 [Bacteroidia bacterium]